MAALRTMFFIRTKGKATGNDGWVVMKTTIGPLLFGFATQQLAQVYVQATGRADVIEAVSQEDLLATNPKALDGFEQMLLFPSVEVLRSFFEQREAFQFQDYVVSLSHAAGLHLQQPRDESRVPGRTPVVPGA